MRFFIDENVPLLVARALRTLGHDCYVVAEEAPSTPDEDNMARARQESRILVTFDSDYARMIFHELKPAPSGVVYMRSRPDQAKLVSQLFLDLFRDGLADPMSRMIIIESGGQVRSVPLEPTSNG